MNRFDVYLINSVPTVGSKIKKTRPCIIISPEEMNQFISTVIVAPMTSRIRKNYPTRITCIFEGKKGQVVLDQIRTVNKTRLVKKLGAIDSAAQYGIISILQEMFSF